MLSTNWKTCAGSALLFALFCAGLPVTASATQTEWQNLFDGQTLKNWVQRGGKAQYKIADETIIGSSVAGTSNTFLCTEKDYSDFILELETMVDPKLNSGIQFRSNSLPEYKNGQVHGYQAEIDPSGRAFSGGIYEEGRRGWLKDLKDNPTGQKAFKNNEWNHYRVEAIGNTLKTWVNGVPTAQLDDKMSTTGFIALQVHADPSPTAKEVKWRHIRILDVFKSDDSGSTDTVQGDYEGKFEDGKPLVAQVIAQGGKTYVVNLLSEFDKRNVQLGTMLGTEKKGQLKFIGPGLSASLDGDTLKGEGSVHKFELRKVVRESSTLGKTAPEGALVLLDGKNLDAWKHANKDEAAQWKLTGDGAMEVVRGSSVVSRKGLGDAEIHIEFKTPFMPTKRGQQRGNSGVYVQAGYEIQVLDSYGLEGLDNECGGLYKVGPPAVNMCYPPGQWQTYDIKFRAARFDDSGKKTENARITVRHNGVVVQDDKELAGVTPGGLLKEDPKEPVGIFLQDHGNPVQFRNIWVVESKQ